MRNGHKKTLNVGGDSKALGIEAGKQRLNKTFGCMTIPDIKKVINDKKLSSQKRAEKIMEMINKVVMQREGR